MKGKVEKIDFLAVYREQILGNVQPGTPAPEGCGAPGCSGGWVTTPRGQARCPKCRGRSAGDRAVALAESGVEGSLYDREWDDLTLTHDSWRLARALGRDIEAVLREVINIGMVGPRGRGKTQALVMISKDAVAAGHSARVVTWADWVDEVQHDYHRKTRTQREHIADLVAPAFLGLDEVGGAASKDGALERKLFTRVIGARYNARKPTAFTANLTRAQLEEVMGERAFDRIQHACEWILFNGPAMRPQVEGGRVRETLERIRREAGVAV